MPWVVEVDDSLAVLTGADVRSVAGLVEFERTWRESDAHAPFDEHTLLSLHGLSAVPHARLTVREAGSLVGCAVLTEGLDGWHVEVAVLPSHRRRGIGRSLVTASTGHVASHGGGAVRSWVHGVTEAVEALSQGARVSRSLLIVRRCLESDLPDRTLPTRSLRLDERDAWLALSNAAFEGHRDNGGWSRADLDWRVDADWTSPARWPVIESQGRLVAGVWTKVEPSSASGELYVVAVHPDAQGRGLGRAVVAAALHQLADAGCRNAHLYVDAENTAALSLYAWAGFVGGEVHRCLEVDVPASLPLAQHSLHH